MTFDILDHTADFGIRVFGINVGDLFCNAAWALQTTALGKTEIKTLEEAFSIEKLHIEGIDWPDLMINWLRELHFQIYGSYRKFQRIDLIEINPFSLTAGINTAPIDLKRETFANEIKAVTYHQATVKQMTDKWQATVIFDV